MKLPVKEDGRVRGISNMHDRRNEVNACLSLLSLESICLISINSRKRRSFLFSTGRVRRAILHDLSLSLSCIRDLSACRSSLFASGGKSSLLAFSVEFSYRAKCHSTWTKLILSFSLNSSKMLEISTGGNFMIQTQQRSLILSCISFLYTSCLSSSPDVSWSLFRKPSLSYWFSSTTKDIIEGNRSVGGNESDIHDLSFIPSKSWSINRDFKKLYSWQFFFL